MFNLFWAVITSVAISLFLRISESHVQHKMVMFATNYITGFLLSLIFIFSEHGPSLAMDDIDAAFGIISGVMYLMSFVLYQYNIKKNGVVLAATFMKLGVLIPILFSIFLFHEIPGIFQKIGFGVALLAILLIYVEKTGQKSKAKIWLIILLLVGGFTDVLAKFYEELGQADHNNAYLLCTFGTAAIVSIAIAWKKKERPVWKDVAWGIAVGVPNLLTAKFLLLSLQEMDGIVVYPVYNVATIFLVGMAGVLFFKERLSKQKWIGYVLVIAAILMLNL